MHLGPVVARIAAAVVVAGLASMPGAAAARPPLKAGLRIGTVAVQGRAIPISWEVANRPAGSRILLQRQDVSGAWRTFALLHGSHGSTAAPPMRLGVRRLRLAVLSHRGTLLIQLRTRIRVYGRVPMSTLIAGLPAARFGTYSGPSVTFDFVSSFSNDCCGQTATVFTVGAHNNRCRSVHVDFTTNGQSYTDGTPPDTVGLSVVQDTTNPAFSDPLGPDAIGTLDVRLTPGRSWALDDTMTQGQANILGFVNGWADCYSRTPWSR